MTSVRIREYVHYVNYWEKFYLLTWSFREIARQRKAQSVPWIADPFTKHEHSKHGHELATESERKTLSVNEDAIEPHDRRSVDEKLEEAEEVEEATPIELFYDLFFVANLTTVTSVHYITEWECNYSPSR